MFQLQPASTCFRQPTHGSFRRPALVGLIGNARTAAPLIPDQVSKRQWRMVCHCEEMGGSGGVTEANVDLGHSDALETVWRGFGDPLLSIGKAGLKPSHLNSLRDLLAAHKVVKVKISRSDTPEEVVEAMCQETNSTCLMRKGSTALFCSDQADLPSLTAIAEGNLMEKKRKRDKKRLVKEENSKDVSFPPKVTALFKSLNDRKIIKHGDFDIQSKRMLLDLPEDLQIKILSGITKKRIMRVKNRSAWLTAKVKLQLTPKSE